MNEIIEITIEHCKNCQLVINKAVDIKSCKGCAIGVIGDSTIFKRVDNTITQLNIFDLLEEV